MKKTSRKPISKKLRFEIFKRDKFTCQYCGSHPPKVILHIDHILPVKLGGNNEIANLVTSCGVCNLGKAAISLSSVPKSLEQAAVLLQEKEAQLQGWNKIHQESYDRLEKETWQVANLYLQGIGEPISSIQRSFFQTIKNYIKELGLYPCIEAMELALSKGFYKDLSTFKYFCGICRNKREELYA